MLYDGDTFENHGRQFTVAFVPEYYERKPWEDDCGVGIVSDWTRRDKEPGERVLCDDRGSKRFYDFAGTVAKATRDGWGLSPTDKETLAKSLGRKPTRKQIIAESVERDFDRIRRWCNDQWQYIGVVVTDCESEESDSLWGIESDAREYLEEVAHELASGIHPLADANEAAAIELGTD